MDLKVDQKEKSLKRSYGDMELKYNIKGDELTFDLSKLSSSDQANLLILKMLNSNARNKETEERGNLLFALLYGWFGIMNETTDGTGAGMIFFENDFVSLPLSV